MLSFLKSQHVPKALPPHCASQPVASQIPYGKDQKNSLKIPEKYPPKYELRIFLIIPEGI